MKAMTGDGVQKDGDRPPIVQRSPHPKGDAPGAFNIVEDPAVGKIPPHKVMPARGIVIGVIASAALWAIIAFFF